MEISICDGGLESRLRGGKAFYCDMTIPLGEQRVEFAHHLEGSLLFAYSGWKEKWIVNIVLCFFSPRGQCMGAQQDVPWKESCYIRDQSNRHCFSNIISNVWPA